MADAPRTAEEWLQRLTHLEGLQGRPESCFCDPGWPDRECPVHFRENSWAELLKAAYVEAAPVLAARLREMEVRIDRSASPATVQVWRDGRLEFSGVEDAALLAARAMVPVATVVPSRSLEGWSVRLREDFGEAWLWPGGSRHAAERLASHLNFVAEDEVAAFLVNWNDADFRKNWMGSDG